VDVYQRRRLVALSAVVGVFVIVVLAVASGGDDDAGDVTAITGATGATGAQGQGTVGKRAYITQADRVCAEANASLETIDASDLAQAAQAETRIMLGQLRQLRALPQPERDRNLANSYLRALRAQVEGLRDRELALEREDDAALVEIDGALASAEADAQAAAAEFGFEVCGDPEAVGEPALDETGAPIEPAPTEPAPAEPAPTEPAPAEPAPAPPADGGTADPDTGGVIPDDGGSGGVSP
jgi:hypothetical protein